MTRTRRRWIAALCALAVLVVVTPLSLGMQTLPGTVPARRVIASEEIEERWDAILDGAVQSGVVDYGLLYERRREVRELVGVMGELGPETSPQAFPDDRARLAYYVNAYDALVIHAVLVQHVTRSVHEVRGLIEPIAGVGFFWAQRFRLDGAWVSLHGLENDILRPRFHDARVHAAIVCASRSCPSLSPRAYRAATLEQQLDDAARAFASDARHVRVDDEAQTIELSSIYDWYASDFVEHARAVGADSSVLGWIAHYASDGAAIERALREGYAIHHSPYDWSLNGHWE